MYEQKNRRDRNTFVFEVSVAHPFGNIVKTCSTRNIWVSLIDDFPTIYVQFMSVGKIFIL